MVPAEPAPLHDRIHGTISRGVLATAERIDAFFYAPQTEVEENRSTFKFDLNLFSEAGEAARYGVGTGLKLVLPGTQERLHLVLAGDPEADDEVLGEVVDDAPEDLLAADETDTDGVSASLRYFLLDDFKRNLSLSAGVRVRDNRLVGFPEARYRRIFDTGLDRLALRFTQRVIWYTDDGWRESSGVDLDILPGRRFLWRATVEGIWAQPDSGYRYDLRFTLFHDLWRRAAMRYEWVNAFQVCTPDQLDEIRFRVRYRQNIWRPWLFFEIAPQLVFPYGDDFDPSPGILLRLETLFGHYDRPGR